ncbi:MAG: hypothetical protein RL885_07100 [Planctomycetota bacterium]
MKNTIIAAGTLGLLSISIWLAVGRSKAEPSPVPAAAPASTASPWVRVRLLDQETLTFNGTWLSHEEWEWPEENTTYDENGVFQSVEGIQLSENVIVVDELHVRAVLDAGVETTIAVPTDCRVALRWKVQDSSIWWHDPETDSTCWIETSTPLDETVRLTRAVKRSDERGTEPAGFGRVLIDDTGEVRIGCIDHELDAATCSADSGGASPAILIAEHESGDIYFWAILR